MRRTIYTVGPFRVDLTHAPVLDDPTNVLLSLTETVTGAILLNRSYSPELLWEVRDLYLTPLAQLDDEQLERVRAAMFRMTMEREPVTPIDVMGMADNARAGVLA